MYTLNLVDNGTMYRIASYATRAECQYRACEMHIEPRNRIITKDIA
jgi:hypothetical protein